MPAGDSDILATLVGSAKETVAEGYYGRVGASASAHEHRGLERSLLHSRGMPIITEVKFVSPAEGRLRADSDVGLMARAMERGGAAGISVLTEPKHFGGKLEYLEAAKRSVAIPVLMKDFVVDPVQLEAAKAVGADAILLIASIYSRNLCPRPLDEMVERAHSLGLEVLLETHSREEFEDALEGKADVVGINNRNLGTMEVSLETSADLLRGRELRKTVICESGIRGPDEVRSLRALGARGFLIGSSIMKSADVEGAVRSFTGVR